MSVLNPEVYIGVIHNGVSVKYVEMKRSTMSIDLVYAIVGSTIRSESNTFVIKYDGFNLDSKVVKMISRTMNTCKLKCYDIRPSRRYTDKFQQDDEFGIDILAPKFDLKKAIRGKIDKGKKNTEPDGKEERKKEDDAPVDVISSVVRGIQMASKKNPRFNIISIEGGVRCELISLGKVVETGEGKNMKQAKITCCMKYAKKHPDK